ncbi:5412_t:CDS:2, partial [Racocetra fulgida]
QANLKKLYENKMLDLNFTPPITITNSTDINFWEAFKQSLNNNKNGPYNRTRILSIIAEKFTYSELQEKLQISHAIKRYIRIGYNVSEGSNIVDAAKELSGTYLANIQPNRAKKEVTQLEDNSEKLNEKKKLALILFQEFLIFFIGNGQLMAHSQRLQYNESKL